MKHSREVLVGGFSGWVVVKNILVILIKVFLLFFIFLIIYLKL